ncbi:MAG: RNA-binding protein [Bacteroidetes bacterium]|nr:MAG: RNA-binding protein [Bacteroidota bacterium]
MNIFVGSLPYRFEEQDLAGIFEAYGEVSAARIIMDRATGRSKGYGFVEMPDDEAAQRAINELDGSEAGGRTIVVNVAQEREPRRNHNRGY